MNFSVLSYMLYRFFIIKVLWIKGGRFYIHVKSATHEVNWKLKTKSFIHAFFTAFESVYVYHNK